MAVSIEAWIRLNILIVSSLYMTRETLSINQNLRNDAVRFFVTKILFIIVICFFVIFFSPPGITQ